MDKEHKKLRKRGKSDEELEATNGWREESLRPLYVSKRAGRLAEYMKCWQGLEPLRVSNSSEALEEFMGQDSNIKLLKKILMFAKARSHGSAIMDLSTCGALPPYGSLVGGKLVAMLAASPDLVSAFRKRYLTQPAGINSKMAGRAIIRPSDLVFMTTTGLYGMRPCQYDRLNMPASLLGGADTDRIRWIYAKGPVGEQAKGGKTEGFGTFHLAKRTIKAISKWTEVPGFRGGSSEFGSGANRTMRLLREGFSSLGIPANGPLVHGHQRTVYVCPLIKNLRRYLLGFEREPNYLYNDKKAFGSVISQWWFERWVMRRIKNPRALDEIKSHTLDDPINHGAQVVLPELIDEEAA
jgi:hypothetical protein